MNPPNSSHLQLQLDLSRTRASVLIIGILLLAITIAGAFFNPGEFFHSYLIGYLFFIGLALGCMAFLMLQYLTGGAWGIIARRPLEAATRTLPLLALLFIPLGFGMKTLYGWAHPDLVAHDAVLQHRSAYTNGPFFLVRAAIYLVIWMALAYFLNRWSADQDRGIGNQQSRLEKLSAPGLILYGFTVTFAAIDWAESLESHWASTIWGFLFIAAEGLTALGFLILVLTILSRRGPLLGVLTPDHFHDLGKMLFATLMLWAYFAFCQYLIVWSENLPDEIPYYLPRTRTSWAWLGISLIVVQFVIPLLLLLNRGLKRSAVLLSGVVVIILIMRYMDLLWIVLPGYHKTGFTIHWMDVLTPLGIGSLWLWSYLRELPRFPLLPLNAPGVQQAIAHQSR